MDEAKLREDALKSQVLSFEKGHGALKEQKKSVSPAVTAVNLIHPSMSAWIEWFLSGQLLRDAKDWQEKHKKLSEEIRVYHTSQKELEDSLVHKENEIEVSQTCCVL